MHYMSKTLFAILISLSLFLNCGEVSFRSTFPTKKAGKTINPGPLAPKKVATGVLFRFHYNKPAKLVALAGTFNGWSKEKMKLVKGDGDVWSITVKLATGLHKYKFVVDHQHWVSDPDNPARAADDSFGNSIINLGEDGSLDMKAIRINSKNPSTDYRKYNAVKSSDWIRSSVLYEVFPRVYTKQKGFVGLEKKLPYLKDLGVDTLWLMPIHPIGMKRKKGSLGCPYSVQDFKGVNPEFGTKADFGRFMKKAHAMGFKVILDWVANHSGWDNRWITSHPNWYTQNKKGKIIHPKGTDWTDVADFNYDSKGMRRAMADAMLYWVREFSVDGFRCDVAGSVPLDFWISVRKKLKRIKPTVMLLAESEDQIHNAKAFDLTYEGGMRSILHGISTGTRTQHDFFMAYQAMVYGFPKKSLRMHWLENHDQTHALSYFGPKAIYPAASVLMMLDGVPLILMGQEFGDKKWLSWKSLFDALQLDWDKFDKRLFSHYKSLIALRKSNRAFTHGNLQLIQNDKRKVVSFIRRDGKNAFLVVVNMSGKKLSSVSFSPADIARLGLKKAVLGKELLSSKTQVLKLLGKISLKLKPYGSKIYKIIL